MILRRVIFIYSYDEKTNFILISVGNDVEYLVFIIVLDLFNFFNLVLFVDVQNFLLFIVNEKAFIGVREDKGFLRVVCLEEQRMFDHWITELFEHYSY